MKTKNDTMRQLLAANLQLYTLINFDQRLWWLITNSPFKFKAAMEQYEEIVGEVRILRLLKAVLCVLWLTALLILQGGLEAIIVWSEPVGNKITTAMYVAFIGITLVLLSGCVWSTAIIWKKFESMIEAWIEKHWDTKEFFSDVRVLIQIMGDMETPPIKTSDLNVDLLKANVIDGDNKSVPSHVKSACLAWIRIRVSMALNGGSPEDRIRDIPSYKKLTAKVTTLLDFYNIIANNSVLNQMYQQEASTSTSPTLSPK